MKKKPVMRKKLEEGFSPKLEELDRDDLLVLSLVMKVNIIICESRTTKYRTCTTRFLSQLAEAKSLFTKSPFFTHILNQYDCSNLIDWQELEEVMYGILILYVQRVYLVANQNALIDLELYKTITLYFVCRIG